MTTTTERFPDYYKILGVGRHCSIGKIKAAYKAQALVLHPDKNQGDGNATETFQRLVGAYSVLKESRVEYNFEYDQLQRNDRILQANVEHGEVECKFDNRGRLRKNYQAKGEKCQRGWIRNEEKREHIFQRHMQQQKSKTKRERRNKAQPAVSASLDSLASNKVELISVMQTGKVNLPLPQHNSSQIDEFNAEEDLKKSNLPAKGKGLFVKQIESDLTRPKKVRGTRNGGSKCTLLQETPNKVITGKELDVHCGERKLRKFNHRPKISAEFMSDGLTHTAFKRWKDDPEILYLRSVREAESFLKILPYDAPRLQKHNDPKIASMDPFSDLENLVSCWDA